MEEIARCPEAPAKTGCGPTGVSMIRYLMAGLTLVLAAPANAAGSEREFGLQMLERLRTAMPDGEFGISPDDPLAIEAKRPDVWDEATINTHRIFGYCRTASADDCDAAAAEFVANISVRPPEPAASDLRVIVRDKAYVDYLLASQPAEDRRPVYRQIGDDLFAIIAFDGPNTIALALRSQLREIGMDDAAAWQLAMAQTKAVLPDLPSGASLAHNAIAFEEYEFLPSLLADTDAWRAIAQDAGPDMFATAVSDYFVFVGILPDGPDLERFKQTVSEDCAAQQRCVSPNVYRFRDGRWVIAE